jgi:hypothetical protein
VAELRCADAVRSRISDEQDSSRVPFGGMYLRVVHRSLSPKIAKPRGMVLAT